MTSRSRPRIHTFVPAYSLLEFLATIAIVVILAMLLFPAAGSFHRPPPHRAEAKAATAQIAAAVKQYYTEYGKYPLVDEPTGSPADIIVGEKSKVPATDNNAELFNILRGKAVGKNLDNRYNPRRINFFDGNSVNNPKAPKSGFLDVAGAGVQGAFYDPWGRQYTIIIDANYNEVINLSRIYRDFTEKSVNGVDTGTRTGVGVFSLGKDGEIGSPKDGVAGKFRDGSKISDDIISWQ